VSSDNINITHNISSPGAEEPQVPALLKIWHRPVISRIEIAQTLQGAGLSASDGDTCPSAS